MYGEVYQSDDGWAGYFDGDVHVDGNLGIETETPGFPLTFANTLGDKISLWGQSGSHYGFGIQSSLLQIHTNSAGADIAFGYGSSDSFTETMRIGGNGHVGIGMAPNSTPRLAVTGQRRGYLRPGQLRHRQHNRRLVRSRQRGRRGPAQLRRQVRRGCGGGTNLGRGVRRLVQCGQQLRSRSVRPGGLRPRHDVWRLLPKQQFHRLRRICEGRRLRHVRRV